MVAIAWICAVAASSLLAATQLAPKLPVYYVGIGGVLPVWAQGMIQTRLYAHVSLHNHNLVPIHVHALTFDLFSADWSGKLNLLGNIQDKQQVWGPAKQIGSEHSSNSTKPSVPAIWKIPAKKFFSKPDYLYTTLNLWTLVKTISRLVYGLWQHSGSLVVTTTGVAHVTSNKIPVTVGLVCDNALHLLSLQVVGVKCALHGVQPGFSDMQASVESLRRYAQHELLANATGGVLYKKQKHD